MVNIIEPKTRAENLVWHFYSKLEHTLNEEYSKNDWNLCVSCSKDVVQEIMNFMKEDDEIHDSCHYANSFWSNYWIDVNKELDGLYKPFKQ